MAGTAASIAGVILSDTVNGSSTSTANILTSLGTDKPRMRPKAKTFSDA